MVKVKKKSKGLTLLEVVIAIGILSIIVLAFFPLFTFTVGNIKRSQAISESTFIAQSVLEDYYNKSLDPQNPRPGQGVFEGEDPFSGKYWVVKEIYIKGDLVEVSVSVFNSKESKQANAQMELHLNWKNRD